MRKYISLLIGLALLLTMPFTTLTMNKPAFAADTGMDAEAIPESTSEDVDLDFPDASEAIDDDAGLEITAEADTDAIDDDVDTDTDVDNDSDTDTDTDTDAVNPVNFEDLNTLWLKAKTTDPKIVNRTLQKNILQDDSHILNLKHITSNMSVSFKSSDTDILTVKKISNSSCRYTGVATGSAQIIISITIDNGFFLFDEHQTLKTTIDVTPHAASVKFRAMTRNLTVGQTRALKMIIRPSISKEMPDFESSNPKVASVNAKGKITAKKAGSTIITATLANGKSAKCRILVENEE